ncbi:hypothetical protein GWK47_048171 [Chionoecetes opilio]|uniref:Uncharacterized protein n=1 Tax=Chionoecetes opilio TaxID=41210 RepID=A0A8J4Y4L3_CHIOP|nr:hypothetical protein GWK47_048171 [Chionoecetes opilio]
MEKLNNVMSEAARLSRTAKLWAQYYNQVMLMHQFVCAEHYGDWALHLDTVREMLPHFHAAGHLAYAKYAHLYVQQISHLEEKMTETKLRQFTSLGNFTVRLSDKLWADIWTDMTIEQVLMRAMKTSGWVTCGRRMTDAVLSHWVEGMPVCTELIHRFEEFCGSHFSTSEQHVDLRQSHQLRDKKDVEKLREWLSVHHPLPQNQELVSIATSVVANEAINCDAAVEIGTQAMNKLVGKPFGEVKLRRKDRVLPLGTVNNSVKVRDEVIPVNTMQLFNRIICVVKSDADFASHLEYELAPRPLSLFDEISMRKTEKSVMYSIIESLCECENAHPTNSTIVVDGGYLLHRVVWPEHGLYSDLYRTYVSDAQKHFSPNCYAMANFLMGTAMHQVLKVLSKNEEPENHFHQHQQQQKNTLYVFIIKFNSG